MAGDEDDGVAERRTCRARPGNQATKSRQPNIENQAAGVVGPRAAQKIPCGPEGLHTQADGRKQVGKGFAHGGIIIDNEDATGASLLIGITTYRRCSTGKVN